MLIAIETMRKTFGNKADTLQKYYKIQSIDTDEYGFTPRFNINGENTFSERRQGKGLFEINKDIHIIGSLRKGLPRLYEVSMFSISSRYPLLLISENVKSILESFNISTHKFIPVKISPEKISTNLEYFILQVDYDSLIKQADFQGMQFKKNTKTVVFGGYKEEMMEKGEIKDYQSILNLSKELNSKKIMCKFIPTAYTIDTNDDIFTIGKDIIVNEFVKDTIETILPNQVQFEFVELLNIKVPQKKYDAKRNRETNNVSIKKSETKIDEEYTFYIEKIKRLHKKDKTFENPIPNDEFYQIQKELNVIIPESFKAAYRNNNIVDTEYYETLPVLDFYYLEKEFIKGYPETYKAVIVAVSRTGNSVGLILQKEDDYKLGSDLYEFLHGSLEVKKY